jgi:hypothetical protein
VTARPEDILQIIGEAEDDVGLRELHQLVRVNTGAWTTNAIPIPQMPATNHTVQLDWDLLKLNAKPLALQRLELRLVVKELQLARRTGHKKVNHRLGLRRDVRWSRFAKGISQQPSQRQLAHAVTALAKEVPARDRLRISCG